MANGLILIVGGVLYVVAGLLIYFKEKSNKFDKGYVWVFFALAHGIDELADGLNAAYNFTGNVHDLLEKVEVTTFMLAGTFLVAGFVSKVTRKEYFESMLAALLSISPMILIVIFSDTALIDEIKGRGFDVNGLKISLFTITFGVLATLIYASVLFSQALSLLSKWKYMTPQLRRKVLLYPFEALMLVVYILSELLVPLNELFVLPEVIAIVVVVITPQEIIFSGNKELQMYLVYEKTGLPILTEKLNPNIPSDILDLVTGFLTAINTMTSEELKLGSLDKIETENGILLSRKEGSFLFAMLVREVNAQTEQLFEKLNQQIMEILTNENYDPIRPVPEVIEQLEGLVLQNVISQ